MRRRRWSRTSREPRARCSCSTTSSRSSRRRRARRAARRAPRAEAPRHEPRAAARLRRARASGRAARPRRGGGRRSSSSARERRRGGRSRPARRRARDLPAARRPAARDRARRRRVSELSACGDPLDRLEQRLELATGGPRDLPARQQTLRATIEWSYELLEPRRAAALRRPRRLRRRLHARGRAGSRLRRRRATRSRRSSRRASSSRDGERFAMLETIREYALERLGDGARRRRAAAAGTPSTSPISRKHAEPELKGTAAARGLERLEAEHDNLRAALDWLLEHDPEAAVRLVDALYLFWYVRGHYREGLRWYERALSVASGDPSARAAVVRRGAALAFACREFPLARSLIGEALSFYRAAGDAPNTVRALTLLGLIAINDGQPDEAVALLEESTALARGADDENVLSFALSNLGLRGSHDARASSTARTRRAARPSSFSAHARRSDGISLELGIGARQPRRRGLAAGSPAMPRTPCRERLGQKRDPRRAWPCFRVHAPRSRGRRGRSTCACGTPTRSRGRGSASARMPSSSRSTPSCTSERREQHSRSSGTKPSLVNAQAAGPWPRRGGLTSPCRRGPRHAAEGARGVRFQAAAKLVGLTRRCRWSRRARRRPAARAGMTREWLQSACGSCSRPAASW